MKKTALFIIGICHLICFSFSCKKKNNDDCPLCPKIDALFPASGKKGDTVIITGSNFSNYLTDNIVKFNGTVVPPADMISGGSTQLKVRVPAKCGTGPVTVTLDDELYSEDGPVFTYATSALVTVFAGSASGGSGNSNGATSLKDLRMNKPSHLAVDASNNVYVLDQMNLKVRKLDGISNTAEVLTDSASLENPGAIAIDENAVLYIASFNASSKKASVFRLTPGSNFPDFYFSDKDAGKRYVSLSLKSSTEFYIGRVNADYAAVIPQICHYTTVKGVELFADSSGNTVAYKNADLYQIRTKPVGSNTGTTFSKYNTTTKAETVLLKTTFGLNMPLGLAVDESGNVYISDTNNNRILKYSNGGAVTTIVSTGLKRPQGLAFDKQGNLYVADTDNHCIKKISFE